MKTSGFLSFSIENILDSTNDSVFTGEHLDNIQISSNRSETSSRPACTPSPIHTSADDSTGAEDSPGENSEPKRKKLRTTFCASHVRSLEDLYSKQQYLPAAQRKKMAAKLGLSDHQVKTWFQNRRMKEKRLHRESHQTKKCLTPEVSFLSVASQIHPSPLALHHHMTSSRPYTGDVIRSPTSLHHWQPIDFTGKTSPVNPVVTGPLRIGVPTSHMVSTPSSTGIAGSPNVDAFCRYSANTRSICTTGFA